MEGERDIQDCTEVQSKSCVHGLSSCSGFYAQNSPCFMMWGDLRDQDEDGASAWEMVYDLCQKHSDLPECACINRNLDPDFVRLSEELGPAYPVGCYWRPCKDATQAWIPPEIHSNSCPDICQAMVRVVGDIQGDIDVSNVVQNVSCDFSDLGLQAYECKDGHCIESDCRAGLDPNCYVDAECQKACQGSNFRCEEGICQPAICAPGEKGCFSFAHCSGYCSSNYRCQNGECSLSTCDISEPTCYANHLECQAVCSTSGSSTLGIIFLVLGGLGLLGLLAYLSYLFYTSSK